MPLVHRYCIIGVSVAFTKRIRVYEELNVCRMKITNSCILYNKIIQCFFPGVLRFFGALR